MWEVGEGKVEESNGEVIGTTVIEQQLKKEKKMKLCYDPAIFWDYIQRNPKTVIQKKIYTLCSLQQYLQ